MKVRTQLALAGVILVGLCGAAQAKTTACGCHVLTKSVQHAAAHRAPEHVSKAVRHVARVTRKSDHTNARVVREDGSNMRRNTAHRDQRSDSRNSENSVSVSRETRNDYNYYDARQTNEDVYNTRQTYARQDEQYGYQQYGYSYGTGDYRGPADAPPTALSGQDAGREQYGYRQDTDRQYTDRQFTDRQDEYSYGYGEYRGPADGSTTQLNGRDFSGGVGYGQSGDLGYYQGGYGRVDPYNGNTAGMNGGVDRARMSVWHGYNGHNGLGNGY